MAVEIIAATGTPDVPGLTKDLSKADLAISNTIYNNLPYIEDQENIAKHRPGLLAEAAALIGRHGMGRNFRPHVAHRHDPLDIGKIRRETKIQQTPYKITEPISTDSVDFSNIHPTCFKVIETGLAAFEFAEGQIPLDVSKISPEFLHEWVNFINKNKLADLISLDCGVFAPDDEPATEIEVQSEGIATTMTVPISACTRDGSTNVPTGWMACTYNPEARESTPPAGQHWNESTKPDGTKTHKVHVDGLSKSSSHNELVHALVRQGVLRAS